MSVESGIARDGAGAPRAESQIAAFVGGLDDLEPPEEVMHRAKMLILDQIGVQLACADLPWVSQVRDYCVEGLAGSGDRGARVIGSDVRLPPELAVLVNGTAGHAFEADDGCPVASAHPSCAVAPVALALGEVLGVTGRRAVLSFIAGAEVVVRLARATMPSMLYVRGFHETAAHGVFGSAVCASYLLDLPAAGVVNALGVASSHASGTSEFIYTGGDVKRLHGGLGAAGGVRAAYLARAGFTGPSASITGRFGFLHSFSPEPAEHWLTTGLGQEWQFLHVLTKMHCCAGGVIAPADALGRIMRDHGVGPDDIESIDVGLDGRALARHGDNEVDLATLDAVTAQFNLHVGVALAALRGANDFDAYSWLLFDAGLAAPELASFIDRITFHVDPESEAVYPGARRARATVRTRDGRTLTEVVTREREYQPTDGAAIDKFLAMAGRRLDGRRCEAVLESVMTLDAAPDLDGLLAALQP